jgi:protein CLEC16A
VISNYNEAVVNKLIGIVTKSVEPEFKVRLATLELAIKLIKSLVILNKKSYINDFHLACIEQAREQSSFILRQKFKVSFFFS